MVAKDYQKNKGSTKVEVGEIDTSAPFQSVKDAVNLFGEGAFSGEKPAIKKSKPRSAERILAKETKFHLAQKELSKFKERLKNAETTKAQALSELEKAKRTVGDLNEKLKSINESKDSAIRASEIARNQAKQFSEGYSASSTGTNESSSKDLESAKVQWMAAVSLLNVAKQELRKILQENHASVETKEMAAKQAAEAETAYEAHLGRMNELSKEIAGIRDSIQQVNLGSAQVMQEEMRIYSDKEKQKHSHKARLEESAKKLLDLKKEIDPELTENLETRLRETLSEIDGLHNERDSMRATNLDFVKTVTMELGGAKESLNKMAEEERSLKCLVETLELELENLKKEHAEVKEKEAETEILARNLQLELQKAKSRLLEALAEGAKIRGDSDDMIASIHQLVSESGATKLETQEMKQKTEELEREAEAVRIELEEAERKLRVAMDEAEEAKVAETRALDQIKILSEKTDGAHSSTSVPGARITISRDEFESLSRKVEESEKLADMNVAATMAQAEAVRASENEALKRLVATRKEIEDMKAATQETLKKAEMAEAAKRAVEGELQRRHEQEQKKATEAASLILAETETEMPLESSPRTYHFQKQGLREKLMEPRKLQKSNTSAAKKTLMPSLTGVFLKKKNMVDGGSPSHTRGGKQPVW